MKNATSPRFSRPHIFAIALSEVFSLGQKEGHPDSASNTGVDGTKPLPFCKSISEFCLLRLPQRRDETLRPWGKLLDRLR